MTIYPSIEELIQRRRHGEVVLLATNRCIRSILPSVAAFLLALFVVVIIDLYVVPIANAPRWRFLHYFSLRWLSVVPIVLLLNVIRHYFNDLYHFEDHRMIRFGGRLSLNYTVPSIKYQDIRATAVSQDLFGRILDYGEVWVGTAGTDGWEMKLHGVRAPHELAMLVEQLRNRSAELSNLDHHADPAAVGSPASPAGNSSLLDRA